MIAALASGSFSVPIYFDCVCACSVSLMKLLFATKTTEIQLSLNHGHVGSSPLSVINNEQN